MLALCGDAAEAQKLAGEARNIYPEGTFVNGVQVPIIMAAIALKANQPQKAVEALAPAVAFERAFGIPVYLRALALLKAGASEKAAAEFQKMVDRRGAYWGDGAVWASAYVGLARACTMAGDSVRARKAYEDFFALWRDADADAPLLVQARKEYAALR